MTMIHSLVLIEPNSICPVVEVSIVSSLYYFYVKCDNNPCVDDKFTVGLPEDLKGSSTMTEMIDFIKTDVSVTCTVASRTLKTKQQSLETLTAAFQAIAATLTQKKQREAKEDLKKGRLELLRMEEILPCTTKKIKTKLLADYGIESSPIIKVYAVPRKSLSSTNKEDVSALTLHKSSSKESDDDLLFTIHNNSLITLVSFYFTLSCCQDDGTNINEGNTPYLRSPCASVDPYVSLRP
jgi:hypothetical protein